MGGRWLKNLGGGTISKCYKSGGAQMVKIRDYISLQKSGGARAPPPVPYTPPAHDNMQPAVI